MSAYDNLNDIQLDVMREIGNIGAGNACTALSGLLGSSVDMSVPSIHLLSADDASKMFKDSGVCLGICVEVADDITGMMINIVTRDFAQRVINTFYPKEFDSVEQLDEMDSSVLNEMGNITSGAYANALATLTNLRIDIRTPQQVVGDVDTLMRIPAEKFMSEGEKLVIIDEEFLIGDEPICSNMILALESDSMVKLFEKLGVQI